MISSTDDFVKVNQTQLEATIENFVSKWLENQRWECIATCDGGLRRTDIRQLEMLPIPWKILAVYDPLPKWLRLPLAWLPRLAAVLRFTNIPAKMWPVAEALDEYGYFGFSLGERFELEGANWSTYRERISSREVAGLEVAITYDSGVPEYWTRINGELALSV